MTRIREAFLARRGNRDEHIPVRLLTAAAIFHLALTMIIFGLGRHGVLPRTFDHDGIAVSFARDGVMFRDGAAELSETLGRGEFIDWATAHQPFHVKAYSICFALFGPLLGKNIMSVEPLNILYYLTILTLVFNLGQEAFGRRVGLPAAIVVALWPSLLLHTTQMLRDQLFIIGMLTFILIMLRWLTRTSSWPEALLRAAAGGGTAVLVWLARDNLAVIMVASGLLGAGLLVARQIAEGRAQTTNLVGMALTLGLTIGVTQALPRYREPKEPEQPAAESVNEAPSETPWGRIAAHVAEARHKFILIYPDAGSNIDGDVRFDGLADIIRYLPRAAAIGFFAPFPDMWFASGKKVGAAGRQLVGVECLMMYLVEALAICGLWRGRRRPSVWLLFLVSAVGMIALGLVVVNVGALYRIRYLFLIMVIILAMEGAAAALGRGTWTLPGLKS